MILGVLGPVGFRKAHILKEMQPGVFQPSTSWIKISAQWTAQNKAGLLGAFSSTCSFYSWCNQTFTGRLPFLRQLHCLRTVILRLPPGVLDCQTPQPLKEIQNKTLKHNIWLCTYCKHCGFTWQKIFSVAQFKKKKKKTVPAATSLISHTLKPSFCPPKA